MPVISECMGWKSRMKYHRSGMFDSAGTATAYLHPGSRTILAASPYSALAVRTICSASLRVIRALRLRASASCYDSATFYMGLSTHYLRNIYRATAQIAEPGGEIEAKSRGWVAAGRAGRPARDVHCPSQR